MKRPDGLTPQQFRVAELVADGLTDARIATRLGVHAQTVRFHLVGIARRWALDPQKNRRVQIANRVLKPAA